MGCSGRAQGGRRAGAGPAQGRLRAGSGAGSQHTAGMSRAGARTRVSPTGHGDMQGFDSSFPAFLWPAQKFTGDVRGPWFAKFTGGGGPTSQKVVQKLEIHREY